MVIDTKAKTGVDKHLHDACGTLGTPLRRAGLSASEIADVLGWEGDRVEDLIAKYVDREGIARASPNACARTNPEQKLPTDSQPRYWATPVKRLRV
jgi:hypothetical protein